MYVEMVNKCKCLLRLQKLLYLDHYTLRGQIVVTAHLQSKQLRFFAIASHPTKCLVAAHLQCRVNVGPTSSTLAQQ